MKRGNKRCVPRDAAEIADHRHPLLLRAQRASHGHCPAQQQDQFAAVHAMTSSAGARIEGSTVSPIALAVLRLTTSSTFTDVAPAGRRFFALGKPAGMVALQAVRIGETGERMG